MDADTILRIRPELTRFLHEFDDCFARADTRRHLDTYVGGQLSGLARKSVEPIADAAGTPPRTLQEFLSQARWDEAAARDRLQQRVARRHTEPGSVGLIDETSFPKKGTRTAGVQRQYCGAVGKTENCVVTVHLGYATADFHTLLDGEPYLPRETWHADRRRCRLADIPEEVVYRPKWQMALGQYRRAVANGVRFGWLTFDEGYGGKPPFLRALDALGQNYVAEVPADFHVWTQRPAVRYRAHGRERRRGRRPRYPRLKAKHNPTVQVQNVLRYSPLLRRAPWQTYHVKDTTKGPVVWEAKHLPVWLKDENGLPTPPHHLVVVRHPVTGEVKYFIAGAPPATPTETLLRVAFSRACIERMFEETKGELGMDHFEVRKWPSIQRHLILSCLSHLFLSEFCRRHRGEKSGPDGAPGAVGDRRPGAGVDPRGPLLQTPRRDAQPPGACDPTTQRPGGPQPPQTQTPSIARVRHHTDPNPQMPLAENLAL
jgi:SRSO17 transposase